MNDNHSQPNRSPLPLTRRRFLQTTSGALAAASIVPSHVLGLAGQPAPNSQVTLAGVGVGGVGFGQLEACDRAGFRIVSLADVDDVYARKAYDRWPQASRYRDFRELLQSEDAKIDAVYVGTPDHTHALIVMAALRRKKHVCCVKPLTHAIQEGRRLWEASREARTATQMTAAPNTDEQACRTCEWIEAGVIGAVREVHTWSNRPVWPQGMARPSGRDVVPDTLDWGLWLGPAPQRPFKNKWPKDHYALTQLKASPDWIAQYNGVYHPFNFRGWWDFGTGALGDMGCHHFNTPFRALNLRHPTRISASSTKVMEETAPLASIVTYDFPERPSGPPVRLVWYDGGLKPLCPELLSEQGLGAEGTLYLGERGVILAGWGGVEVLPEGQAMVAEAVPKTLPRRSGTWGEWHDACRGGETAGCAFDWAIPLTETVLLGNTAIRIGEDLQWDGPAGRFTNSEPANTLINPPYHNGWSLDKV